VSHVPSPAFTNGARQALAMVALVSALAVALLLSIESALGQDPKPEEKPKPAVIFALPIGAIAGGSTKIKLRGPLLGEASEVKVGDSSATAKILNKGGAPVPDKYDPKLIGDTQVEIELTVPPDAQAHEAKLTVVTPQGEAVWMLPIAAAGGIIAEKEPNGGFRDSQPLDPGQTIEGLISYSKDVDVYRITGVAGQRMVFEVLAARRGSPLDALLTLYDSEGQTLATSDDQPTTTDARLEVVMPSAGAYYLGLVEANDRGTEMHAYRLTASLAP